MASHESATLKIMRLIEPNLDTNCAELLDISDCIQAIDPSYKSPEKPNSHFPILRIPSYSNEVLLGETLHMTFILGNNSNAKLCSLFLKVEMVMEDEEVSSTCTIFENLELEPKCKPLESHYSYLFEKVSNYRMTCSVEYSTPKGPHVLKKMFIWNCIDPVELSHSLITLPDGLSHVETRVNNKSKTILVIKEIKLEDRGSKVFYSPLVELNKDNICLLRPDETAAIIFPNVQIYRSKSDTTDKGLYLNLDWHSYTNTSGTNVYEVNLPQESDLFYKIVNFPKSVKVNEPFNTNIYLKNLTKDPMTISVSFNSTNSFCLQNEKTQTINLDDTETVYLPLVPLATGLHHLTGIEIHRNQKVYNVDDLQILVTE
ncbi:uncharacterized protein TA08035 [Theileria annulata]|uniref:Uncharacterized protein n=1 Tax=Theileria annulata TaxID=5874 RepID=Q4U9V0_THEAN|nr:uncharacterized protein TA08035 [Theileria annulata]CAI76403.1 hypothetical protein, conserved [Theileria annulata]|eukprot:XP_953028.1 hypothetical protein, conserved [Theileria annulata]